MPLSFQSYSTTHSIHNFLLSSQTVNGFKNNFHTTHKIPTFFTAMAYTKLVTFALVAIVFCVAIDAATTVNTHPVHKKVVRPAQQVAAATQEGDVTKGVQPAATAGEKIAAILGLTPEGGETLVRLSIKMKPLAAEYAPKIYAAMRSMITSYFK